MSYSFGAPEGFEALVKTPFNGLLDRFIEDEGKEGNGEEPELCGLSAAFCVSYPALSDGRKEGR